MILKHFDVKHIKHGFVACHGALDVRQCSFYLSAANGWVEEFIALGVLVKRLYDGLFSHYARFHDVREPVCSIKPGDQTLWF